MNPTMPINKILIANRGEIALRIIRTAKKMGIKTVLVYAAQDAGARYLTAADEAILLEGNSLAETYLNIDAIIATAKSTNADAIHPGYGFLSENAAFARACKENKIVFIGPPAEAMEAMGNKIAARETAVKAGVPITEGITGSVEELKQNYSRIPFPILIKAAAGGGGKGMRVVHSDAEIATALEATAREAQNYFGDNTIYIEQYIREPRHVEVQVLGDQHSNIIHLYERECSLQRRHQKIVEEAGSPTLTPAVREKLCADAVALAASINYQSAGTLEFLVGADLNYYFLEMNTRIQVEHPVTELTTGIDIVEQQIRIAEGEILPDQEDIHQTGHAIECRIYAEDPERNFLPAPGKISFYKEPAGEDIRVEGMLLESGSVITGDFDPMISKLITYGKDRETARHKMIEALSDYYIYGIKNNISFLQHLLRCADFIENKISTKYIDEHLGDLLKQFTDQQKEIESIPIIAAALCFSFIPGMDQPQNLWQEIGYWRTVPLIELTMNGAIFRTWIKQHTKEETQCTINGKNFTIQLKVEGGRLFTAVVNNNSYPIHIVTIAPGIYELRYKGFDFTVQRNDLLHSSEDGVPPAAELISGSGNIVSPMPGKVIKIAVKKGDPVKKGDLLLVVEAMKMENNITSPYDGTIEKINTKENEKVDTSTILIDVKQS